MAHDTKVPAQSLKPQVQAADISDWTATKSKFIWAAGAKDFGRIRFMLVIPLKRINMPII